MKTTRQSVFSATIRTVILLAALSGLLVSVGYIIGGIGTATIFLGIALVINFVSYFFSDKIALKMSRAQPLTQEQAPKLYSMIEDLRTRAKLPMPRVYRIADNQANAFATGRSPKHSAVAVTDGLVNTLTDDELRGVIAHELAHIQHRDILIQSVAASIGAAITYIGYMIFWVTDDDSVVGLIGSLLLAMLAPLAATIIQMSVSRQREYAADAQGAALTGNPESLASALMRLEASANTSPMQVNDSIESLYIIKPFAAKGIGKMFSTHPPTEERVKRLREMRPSL
jgi:heat shock protein HtpX